VSNRLEQLRSANPGIAIHHVAGSEWQRYGRLLDTCDPSEIIARANAIIPNSEGVVYEPAVEGLEVPCAFNDQLQRTGFGGMPIQAGWCYGKNTRMDAREYHKGVMVVVCLTDVVMLVGSLCDVTFGDDIVYDASSAEAFWAPAGAVVESSAWCLHYAPIHTTANGAFATLIYLPRGTNTDLQHEPERSGEGRLLLAVNKWLIAHPEAEDLVKDGGYPGIVGPNVRIAPAP